MAHLSLSTVRPFKVQIFIFFLHCGITHFLIDLLIEARQAETEVCPQGSKDALPFPNSAFPQHTRPESAISYLSNYTTHPLY